MTGKSDFTAEEWSLLRQAPVLAALVVADADEGGTVDELASIAHFFGEVRDHLWARGERSASIGLVDEGPEFDRARFGSAEEGINAQAVADAAPPAIGEAIATAQRKGDSEDLERYRRFILALARRVAEAHREGGILGIGGKPISEREQAALDELAGLVGLPGTER
jgi:hypothetical protein